MNTVLYQDETYTIQFSIYRQICGWVSLVLYTDYCTTRAEAKICGNTLVNCPSNVMQMIAHTVSSVCLGILLQNKFLSFSYSGD